MSDKDLLALANANPIAQELLERERWFPRVATRAELEEMEREEIDWTRARETANEHHALVIEMNARNGWSR